MTSDNHLRAAWRDYKCTPARLQTVTIAGRNLQVAPPTIESWRALSAVLTHHKYEVRKSDTGSYNCKNIRDTDTPSLHSYGIAIDINWNTNPYKRTPDRRAVRYSAASSQADRAAEVRAGRADTDMTPEMIADVLAIKTKSGSPVFDWGGSWQTIKDAMHFELDVGPDDLAVGIDWGTVAGGSTSGAREVGGIDPATADTQRPDAFRVVARDGLRLRAGNGTEFEIVALVRFGSIVYEVKRDDKWSLVDLNGDGAADGSVHNSYLVPAAGSSHAGAADGADIEAQQAGQPGGGEESAAEFRFLNTHHSATDLVEDRSLPVVLDLQHDPFRGWQISRDTRGRFFVTWEGQSTPLTIGKSVSYTYDSRGITTVGLGRPSYDRTPGHVRFEPDEWNDQFDHWPELLFPTAHAESGADFSVINAWDLAGLTVGFIQLAAHTSDDLIPFFKKLIAALPDEAERYFPELTLVNGELCYRRSGKYRRLEVRWPAEDPVPNDLVDRGLFVSFFNKNRQALGDEELHAAARWLAWTQESDKMRRLQVAASVDNMRDSLNVLHRALLSTARAQYPRGVDGMRCDHLAAALAVPHLNPSRVDKAVSALCHPDVLHAFEKEIEYGPGDREKNVVDGVRKRGRRLADLTFDLAQGRPV
ncbi:M15 family metallopeptidase [Rhodoplanes elegans]|nr:M15 family metallopeptidase [Rhodoplanes elegans]